MNVVMMSGLSASAGGIYYAVGSLAKALVARDVEVSVVGCDSHCSEDQLFYWRPAKAFEYKAYGPLASSFKVRSLITQLQPQLVHQHGLWLDDQWASLQWQKRENRPVIISPHGMLDSWALRNAAWKKKLVGGLFANESLRRASCIHALCRSELESIRAYGLKNPVAVIPNGVELPEVGGRRSEVGSQRLEVGGRKKLLFLGRIHPKKGLAELLQAWGMEHGAWRRDWQLVIAGWDDGDHERGLRALAGQLGLGGEVEFIGPRYGAEKDTLLRTSDAFILPSFSEGLPMSVLEAWSYRIPVIMTPFCNLPEGFESDAAIRIEPTAASIAEGLSRLSSLPAERLNAMGDNGYGLVARKFTWAGIAANMKQVYEWCLTGGEPPSCVECFNADG